MSKYTLRCLASARMSALFSASVFADDLQFHGYISQAMISSEDNPFYVSETRTHFNFREIGLNSSWQISDELRAAGQLLSCKAGDLDDGDPRVDFLLLDYSLSVTDDSISGVRLGRVKSPYGIYNTTRDVPHARPGVIVPQSVYFEAYWDTLLSVDGVDLYLNSRNSLGDISFDLYAGETQLDNAAIEYQVYQKDVAGEFRDVEKLGLKLGLVPKNQPNLTIALTFLNVSIDLQDAPSFTATEQLAADAILAADPRAYTDYITSQHVDSLLTLISLQYNLQSWVLTGEYLDINSNISSLEVLHQAVPSYDATSRAYYFQAEWLGWEQFTLYVRHENLYYNENDKDGKEFASRTRANPVSQYNKTKTIGVRWYYTTNLSLTGEYSHNHGSAYINDSDIIDYSQIKESRDLLVLQLSYHF